MKERVHRGGRKQEIREPNAALRTSADGFSIAEWETSINGTAADHSLCQTSPFPLLLNRCKIDLLVQSQPPTCSDVDSSFRTGHRIVGYCEADLTSSGQVPPHGLSDRASPIFSTWARQRQCFAPSSSAFPDLRLQMLSNREMMDSAPQRATKPCSHSRSPR